MGPILGPVVKHQRLLFSWFSFPAELMEVMSAAVTKKPIDFRGLTQATLVCGSHKAQLAMWGGSSAPRVMQGPRSIPPVALPSRASLLPARSSAFGRQAGEGSAGAPGGGSVGQTRTSRPHFCPHSVSQNSVTCQCLMQGRLGYVSCCVPVKTGKGVSEHIAALAIALHAPGDLFLPEPSPS